MNSHSGEHPFSSFNEFETSGFRYCIRAVFLVQTVNANETGRFSQIALDVVALDLVFNLRQPKRCDRLPASKGGVLTSIASENVQGGVEQIWTTAQTSHTLDESVADKREFHLYLQDLQIDRYLCHC